MHGSIDPFVGEWLVGFLLLFFLYTVCMIIGQVLFGLATYHDAKAKRNDNPAMWGLLVGFLGLIPGIIYLCLRNEGNRRLIACPTCGISIQISQPGCPNCGNQNPYAAPFFGPEVEALKKKAKRQLIAAIVLEVSSILLMIIGFIVMAGSIIWNTGVFSAY